MAVVNSIGETSLIEDLNDLINLTGGVLGNPNGTKSIDASSTFYLNSTSPSPTSSSFDSIELQGEGLLYDANNLPIGGTITSMELLRVDIGSRGQRFVQQSQISDISLEAGLLRSGTAGNLLFVGDDAVRLGIHSTGFSSVGASFATGEGNDTIIFGNGGEPSIGIPSPAGIFTDAGNGNDTIVFDLGQPPTISQTVVTGEGVDTVRVAASEALLNGLDDFPRLMTVNDFDPQFDRVELPVGNFQSGKVSWRVEAEGADTKIIMVANDATGTPLTLPTQVVLKNVAPDQIDLGADGVITGAQTIAGAPVFGTEGADVLFGNPDANIINGLGGDDAIITFENNDVLLGGEGNDSLDGGSGNDQLFGENGNDQIFAGEGDDVAFGGFGDDLIVGDADGTTGDDGLFGEDGNDLVYGGFGVDFISGGNGNDVLFGETGNDEIIGGAGDDTMIGGSGEDVLTGGDGADSLDGGTENDELYGNDGNDQLFGGAGDDILAGGDGNDLLVGDAEGTSGIDILNGGNGDDEVYGGFGRDAIFGGNGNDVLFGETGKDGIYGGAGNDVLFGGSGDDQLNGDVGDDVMDGGAGYDVFDGGAGNDTLYSGEDEFGSIMRGGIGNDVLHGGQGVDQLHVGAGFDVVYGNGAADLFYLRDGQDFNIWNDFEDGTDRIIVERSASNLNPTFEDVSIFETLDGTGTWIGYADTQLILGGIDADLIDEEDFSFA